MIITTPYGDTRLVQKSTRWLARHRPRALRAWRCSTRKHNPSPDTAFTCNAQVFVGGPCTRCDNQAINGVCDIGDQWQFPGVVVWNRDNGIQSSTTSLRILIERIESLNLKYIGDFPA